MTDADRSKSLGGEEDADAEVARRLSQFLALPLYMSRSRPITAELPPTEAILEHLRFVDGLERSGVLFMSGPFMSSPERADGEPKVVDTLAVIRAADGEEAIAIVGSDPLHRDGYREFELEAWRLDAGSLDLRLHLGSATYSFG
jgi:uncharacterized protein